MRSLVFFVVFVFCLFAQTSTNVRAQESRNTAQAFDQLFDEIIRSNHFYSRFENVNQHEDIPELNKLIPVNDRVREVRFASIYCSTLIQEKSNDPRAFIDRYLDEAKQLKVLMALALLYQCSSQQYYTEANSADEGKHAQLAVDVAKQSGNSYVTIVTLHTLSSFKSRQGEQANSIQLLHEAEQLLLTTPEKYALSMASSGLAKTYRRLGEYEKAIAQSDKIKTKGLVSSTFELFSWHYARAMIYLDWKKPTEAIDSMQKALQHTEGDQKEYLEGFVDIALGRAYLMRDSLDEAEQHLSAAKQVFNSRGYDYHLAFINMLQADLEAKRGNHQQAMRLLDRVTALIQLDGYPRIHHVYAKQRAASAKALGQYDEALEYSKKAVSINQEIDGQTHVQKMLLKELELDNFSTSIENDKIQQQLAIDSMHLVKLKERRKWQHLLTFLSLAFIALLLYLLFKQRKQSALFREMNMRDALTGVLSRRGIHEYLERMLLRLHTDQQMLSVMMLDVDHFKSVNDTFGHPAGDRLLIAIAENCKHAIRPTDKIGRLGGEEFMVVCVNTDFEQALSIAERLREQVASTSVTHKSNTLQTTVSIGVTTCHPDDTLDSIMQRADKALYQAKHAGRNQVVGKQNE